MTKKDYELIARELKAQHELVGNIYRNTERYQRACTLWAATLGADNPRFDRDKFLKACGIDTKPWQVAELEADLDN